MPSSPYQAEFQDYLWSTGEGFDWRWVLGVSLALSLWCLFHLFRSTAPWHSKLVWTLLVLFPLVGPLMFAALFRPPSPQSKDLQAPPASGIGL
ncbi:MAG: PLDc_N domain-containing protein [Verrucomicrobiae bacterium]|nr:PLDc_N domain-containing protein [Verrucomicrobiae bacterium]